MLHYVVRMDAAAELCTDTTAYLILSIVITEFLRYNRIIWIECLLR